MDQPPPAPSPPSPLPNGSAAPEAASPGASEEPGAPATATASAASKEAPVTDTTHSTHADAQGGLHDAAVSNPENNNEASTSTRGDSPWSVEALLVGDSLVQATSKQAVNSDGTRKRNFQPGNKEAVHVLSAGSKSHAREISVAETKDSRSKFLKKSDNEDPACEGEQNAGLAGISEELKENNNRSALNSTSLKDEKKQKNRSRGKENSNHVHNTSTSHDLSLPASTGTACLTSMVTESTEAPKCMGLKVKQNLDEVALTNSFTVVSPKTTDGGSVNVDSTIQKNPNEVLSGSLKEKETENVATSLGSCVVDSNQLPSSNVSLIPLQGVIVDADVKKNCLHSSTEEKVYQSAVIKPSDLVSQPNISEEHKNLGSAKHMREPILRMPFNSNTDPNFRAGVHQRRNIYGSGGIGNSEHEIQRNQPYPFNEGANFFQRNQTYPFNEGANFFQRNQSFPFNEGANFFQRNQSFPFDEGANFFQRNQTFPNEGPNFFQRNQSYPFNEGANFFQQGRADPEFRAGAHHSMNMYGSGGMGNLEHGFQRNQSFPFNEGPSFFQVGRADPNLFQVGRADPNLFQVGREDPYFRAGVHRNMSMYGAGAMGNPDFEFQRNQSYPFNEGANFFQPGRGDPNFRAGVHHSMNINGSGAIGNLEHGFRRSYLDYTSTQRNEMQEKEPHNNNRISPSNLAQAYSEKLRMSFPPRDSLTAFRKKKLIILDLNGLLADINEDFHNAHMADAKVRRKLVFRRPYCDDFLNFCIKNFELGIWSSRKRKNVDSVVDILMKDLKPYLLFSWARDKCTSTGRNTLENVHKPIVLKELRKVWNKEETGLPWEEGEFSPSNTLLIDDSPYKALRNPPHTAIFPHPFSYLNRNDNSLGPGGDLRVYLENLASADDVECYVRNHPFGQPFITQSDPHWNFYAEIAGEGYGSLACRA